MLWPTSYLPQVLKEVLMQWELRSDISWLGQKGILTYKNIFFLFNFFVVTPGITKKEYRDRRQRLLRLLSVCSNYLIGAHSCLDNYYCDLDFLLKEFSLPFKNNLMQFYSIITYSLLSKTHFGESHDKHLVIIPSNPTKFMTTDVP